MQQILADNKYAQVVAHTDISTVVCTLKTDYVPMKDFQDIFVQIGDYIKANPMQKMILDKRNLKVFHQASMVWYHVEWKQEMKQYGLVAYRKLLPDDAFFRKAVEIARKNILKEHPEFRFEDFDIRYCETMDEALQSEINA
ncbi:hypothetical protein [Rhodoflexus caldus]|uniref:hypothetical protein n=1 Tax=Rhodoflexus caldus TaxID=2891236 RepID=UPI00202A17DD|nr:hypothetical protein [Rhodoflexus caldus]